MGLSFLSSAFDFVEDVGIGVANGLTFGNFGRVTGLKACGIAGTIGSWAGSAILGYATGGLAELGFAYATIPEEAAALGGGLVNGATATVSLLRATGQQVTPWNVGLGAVTGAGAVWVAQGFPELPNPTQMEVWKNQRVPTMGTSGVDLLMTLFGPGAGGSRKC